jgi:hypothetical protein
MNYNLFIPKINPDFVWLTEVDNKRENGEVYGDGDYGPKDLMPQLLPYYQNIKNCIMKAISEK